MFRSGECGEFIYLIENRDVIGLLFAHLLPTISKIYCILKNLNDLWIEFVRFSQWAEKKGLS